MISLEPIGIGQAVSSRHRSGKDSNPAADFINGVATAAVSSSSSAAPGSAISSRHFSVEDEVDPHSAGLAGGLRQPQAGAEGGAGILSPLQKGRPALWWTGALAA